VLPGGHECSQAGAPRLPVDRQTRPHVYPGKIRSGMLLWTLVAVDQSRSSLDDNELQCHFIWGWDLAEWSERCTNMLKVAGWNPSDGSESTFPSDLLSTARGSSM
jgi:hypothetical protein